MTGQGCRNFHCYLMSTRLVENLGEISMVEQEWLKS